MSDVWYEFAEPTDPVTQGDLIADCPVLTWQATTDFDAAKPEETLKAARRAVRTDVVVMTQACDLAEHHVHNVTLCPHLALSRYRELWDADLKAKDQNPTAKAWKTHCEQTEEGLRLEPRTTRHRPQRGGSSRRLPSRLHGPSGFPRGLPAGDQGDATSPSPPLP